MTLQVIFKKCAESDGVSYQVKTGRWMQPEWLAWADVF